MVLFCIMVMLERFSFYGLRSIIVLYAISSDGLDLPRKLVLNNYENFGHLIILLLLPMGIITDLILRQKRAIVIGGIISLAGYLLIFSQDLTTLVLGLILIITGSSLVRLNIPVLITRLFEKTDTKRNLGMAIYILMINLGAFLASLTVVLVAETMSYKIALFLIFISSFIYLLIYLANVNRIKFSETNIESTVFFKMKNLKKINWKLMLLIVIILLIYVTFIFTSTLIYNYAINIFSTINDINLYGIEVTSSMLISSIYVFSIPINLIIVVLWAVKGAGKTLNNILWGFLFLGISLITLYISLSPNDQISAFVLIPFFLLSLAELIILPLLFSYSTRISDTRFTSTVYSVLLIVSAISFDLFQNQTASSSLIIMATICFLLTTLIFWQKSRIYKIAEPLQ